MVTDESIIPAQIKYCVDGNGLDSITDLGFIDDVLDCDELYDDQPKTCLVKGAVEHE